MTKKRLSSHMEDYLEAIAILKKRNGIVRVKDVSEILKVKTSSVTSAMNMLSRKGMVAHERYGYIELTPEGEEIAMAIQKRHAVLTKFLTDILKIDPKVSEEDACRLEHSISPQTFTKLTKFIEFVETSPSVDRPAWLKSFDHYFKTGKRSKCIKRK